MGHAFARLRLASDGDHGNGGFACGCKDPSDLGHRDIGKRNGVAALVTPAPTLKDEPVRS